MSLLDLIPGVAPAKLIIGGILLIGVLSFAGYAWYQWNDMKATIASQKVELSALNLAKEEQDKTIEQGKKDINLQKQINLDILAEKDKATARADDMENRFKKTSKLLGERDFGKLAVSKPDVVEKMINNGTKEMIRCFELASGAELTEKERNTKKLSEINSICPDLIKPEIYKR